MTLRNVRAGRGRGHSRGQRTLLRRHMTTDGRILLLFNGIEWWRHVHEWMRGVPRVGLQKSICQPATTYGNHQYANVVIIFLHTKKIYFILFEYI